MHLEGHLLGGYIAADVVGIVVVILVHPSLLSVVNVAFLQRVQQDSVDWADLRAECRLRLVLHLRLELLRHLVLFNFVGGDDWSFYPTRRVFLIIITHVTSFYH